MALTYAEFDTTQQALLTDLRTNILACTDWTRLTSDTVLLTTSAATNAGATVLPFTDTSTSGLAVGSIIGIDTGANKEWRRITAISATSITVAALSFAHALGTQIVSGSALYKATTTRGADMVFDLADDAPSQSSLTMAIYRAHDGVTGTDKVNRYLYWRASGGVTTQPLHCIVSASKEHIYISIEGPRAGEPSTFNANYGSMRQYFFMCDLVPYYGTDSVPVVVAGGSMFDSGTSAIVNLSHMTQVSRNLANTASWVPARMASLSFPAVMSSECLGLLRQDGSDNSYVLAPYVVFQDDSGMRGRLNNLFYAGITDSNTPEIPLAPVGTKTVYQGQNYKMIQANKSDSGRNVWGCLGSAANNGGATLNRSVVVAVPCT